MEGDVEADARDEGINACANQLSSVIDLLSQDNVSF